MAQSNKAPGLDGLPTGIYKKYGQILLSELLEVINDALNTQKLPKSMQETTIIVILKLDKDPLKPEACRPIQYLSLPRRVLQIGYLVIFIL